MSRSANIIETSFLAIFKYKPMLSSEVISFNAEYDALPEIGNVCGYILIAIDAIAAAIAAAEAMIQSDFAERPNY